MDLHEPPAIGEALLPVRAAFELVTAGTARRITVHVVAGGQILPAVRALAREAGLSLAVEYGPDGTGCEIAITLMPARAPSDEARDLERESLRAAR